MRPNFKTTILIPTIVSLSLFADGTEFAKVIHPVEGNATAQKAERGLGADDIPLLKVIPENRRVPLIADGEMRFTVRKRAKSDHAYLEKREIAGIPLDRPWTVKTLLEELGDIKGIHYRAYGDATIPSDPDVKISDVRTLAAYMERFGYSIREERGEESVKVFVTRTGGDER